MSVFVVVKIGWAKMYIGNHSKKHKYLKFVQVIPTNMMGDLF
jgi:hypothetical protein